jgi:hypothetical protein
MTVGGAIFIASTSVRYSPIAIQKEISAFDRPREPADELSDEASHELRQFLASADRVGRILKPSLEDSRRLVVDPATNTSVFAAPTPDGSLCYAGAGIGSGCEHHLTDAAITFAMNADRNRLLLFGFVGRDVLAIHAKQRAASYSAILGDGAYMIVIPGASHDEDDLSLVIRYRSGGETMLPLIGGH